MGRCRIATHFGAKACEGTHTWHGERPWQMVNSLNTHSTVTRGAMGIRNVARIPRLGKAEKWRLLRLGLLEPWQGSMPAAPRARRRGRRGARVRFCGKRSSRQNAEACKTADRARMQAQPHLPHAVRLPPLPVRITRARSGSLATMDDEVPRSRGT